jgi:(2Fe-2S) ferredoxin
MASIGRVMSSQFCSTSQSVREPVVWRSKPIGRQPALFQCGVKSESRQLAKAVKAHKKRLERLLRVETSQDQLQRILRELSDLSCTLAVVRSQVDAALLPASVPSQHSEQQPCSVISDPSWDSACPPSACVSPRAIVATMTALLDRPPLLDEVTVPTPLQSLGLPSIDFDEESEAVAGAAPVTYPTAGRVVVCQGSKCLAKGGLAVLQEVSKVTSNSPDIEVLPCKCLGKCKQGAALRVKTANGTTALYTQVEAERVREVVDHHFMQPVAAAVDASPESTPTSACSSSALAAAAACLN